MTMLKDADGHELASQQIKQHGKDRYPTITRQIAQLTKEVGELLEAADIAGRYPTPEALQRFRDEYADVGLSLFEVGNKAGIDLLECMRSLVSRDQRRFAETDQG